MTVILDSKQNVIGLFGGSFNPIHWGHIKAVNFAQETLQIPEVRLIPTAIPAHRASPDVDASQRGEMVKLAIQDYPKLQVDLCELARDKPSYTIDTLRYFREEYPDTSLVWFSGSDSFLSLPSWDEWELLLEYAHFVILHRPGNPWHTEQFPPGWVESRLIDDPALLHASTAGHILRLDNYPYDISSTAIRDALKQGDYNESQVPASVLTYIKNNQLYQQTAIDAVDQRNTNR